MRIEREKEGEALGQALAQQGQCGLATLSPLSPAVREAKGSGASQEEGTSSLFLLPKETLWKSRLQGDS